LSDVIYSLIPHPPPYIVETAINKMNRNLNDRVDFLRVIEMGKRSLPARILALNYLLS